MAAMQMDLVRVQAEVGAEQEARDRQADAFDAAVARIEFVNAALVAFIAIAGVGGSLLAVRWVRNLAREQVVAQVDFAIREAGEEIFRAEANALSATYEEKFAKQYAKYQNLIDPVE